MHPWYAHRSSPYYPTGWGLPDMRVGQAAPERSYTTAELGAVALVAAALGFLVGRVL